MVFDDSVVIPGVSFHVDLAALDARHPVHYSRRLLLFRCSSETQHDAQLAALKAGLHGLLSRCPVLGGMIVPLPPDEARNGKEDWRTIVPDRGIELIVKDLSTAMPSFEELEAANFPPTQFPYELLVPVPHDLGNERPFPACKIQYSSVIGGTIVTFAMSHSVADGSGNNELLRILSEETRLAQRSAEIDLPKEGQPSPGATVVGVDRRVMRNMTGEIPFRIEEHPGFMWKTNGEAKIVMPHPFEAASPELPILIYISAANLAQLKADATTPGAPPISTHDALCALMWRSLLFIRSRRPGVTDGLRASTIGEFFMPSDARRHINLPESYIGNAVYQLTATLELDVLLSPSGLQHAASAVRRAITTVTPALVSSYIAMTREKWVDWRFLSTASTTGAPVGTDWTSGGLYKHDWGSAFGPLLRYRYPGGLGQVFNCILPKLPDVAAELAVGVMPQEADMLRRKECFGRYLEAR